MRQDSRRDRIIQIRWLKGSFIAGTIADGIVGVLMLNPSRMGETEFKYPLGLVASLMFGWALPQIWRNQKPVERKAVLLFTIFPVITGLLASGIYQVATGAFPFARVLPNNTLGMVLIGLMGFSYFKARTLRHQ